MRVSQSPPLEPREPSATMRLVATVEHPTETLITLTPLAAQKVKDLLAEEPASNPRPYWKPEHPPP